MGGCHLHSWVVNTIIIYVNMLLVYARPLPTRAGAGRGGSLERGTILKGQQWINGWEHRIILACVSVITGDNTVMWWIITSNVNRAHVSEWP